MSTSLTPRLLRFHRFVRRRGIPHEETVVFPAMIALACVTQSEHGHISVDVAALLTTAGMFVSGAWLGFSWSKPRIGSLIIRAYLIGFLVVGGYVLGNHSGTETKMQYQHDYVEIVQTFGLMWFAGWSVGFVVHEATVTLYISDIRRAAFEDGWAYRLWTGYLRHPISKYRYLRRVVSDVELQSKANRLDQFLAVQLNKLLSPAIIFEFAMLIVGWAFGKILDSILAVWTTPPPVPLVWRPWLF